MTHLQTHFSSGTFLHLPHSPPVLSSPLSPFFFWCLLLGFEAWSDESQPLYFSLSSVVSGCLVWQQATETGQSHLLELLLSTSRPWLRKKLLFVQFSLASSLVSSSSLLDDSATICLYIISPGLLCTVFSYLAQEICKWKQLGILSNSLFAVYLRNTHAVAQSPKLEKHRSAADVVWRLSVWHTQAFSLFSRLLFENKFVNHQTWK